MNLRFVLLACLVALPLALPARAGATPRLVIAGVLQPGAAQTKMMFSNGVSDPAPARLTLYAPSGYTGTVTASAGTVLGTAQLTFITSQNATVPTQSQITAANPADFASNACSPGTHTAIWVIRASVNGQTLTVPMFVDSPAPATDPRAAASSFRVIMCFSSPYVAPDQGGAPAGARLISANLTVNQGTLRTPLARGTYIWRAVVAPYAVGGALPNAAGTVEARGIFRTPALLSINVKVTNRKKRTIRATGTLRYGDAPFGRTLIKLFRAGKPNANRAYRFRMTASRVANSNGDVVFNLRFKRKGWVYLRLNANSPSRDFPAGCTPPTEATLPCASATLSSFSVVSRVVRIRL